MCVPVCVCTDRFQRLHCKSPHGAFSSRMRFKIQSCQDPVYPPHMDRGTCIGTAVPLVTSESWAPRQSKEQALSEGRGARSARHHTNCSAHGLTPRWLSSSLAGVPGVLPACYVSGAESRSWAISKPRHHLNPVHKQIRFYLQMDYYLFFFGPVICEDFLL